MRLAIQTNVADLAKDLEDLARKQVPFATALALTRTAQDVRGHLRETLGDYFVTRNKWVAGSMQMTKATKATLEAHAGTVYEPMALQDEGGQKTGKDGGTVAVPVAARADETKRTTPATWPGRLAKKRDFFLATFGDGVVGKASDGSGGVGIFQRIGRRAEKKHLKLWWLIEPEVHVEPRWPFEDLARATVERELVDNFWSAMEQAMATAHPRTG